MTTSQHCSFRTFWIGYCDWFASRTAMTHKEALQEARQQHGSYFPLKLVGLAVAVVILLVIFAASAPFMVSRSVAAGATSQHVLFLSQWGTVLTISAVVGAVAVSRVLRITRFCREMCDRGRALEAARAAK